MIWTNLNPILPASNEVFAHRFFQLFDAFYCLKFVHFYRDYVSGNKPLLTESRKLLDLLGETAETDDPLELLKFYRNFEARKSPSLYDGRALTN